MDEKIDIKSLRERLGWTQGEMADYLGLDRSSISRMENGQEIKGPAARLLQQLVDEDRHLRPAHSGSEPIDGGAAA